jgi:NAD(P)-dependent dehydrogenase (short-subunit alcohol dehydrogenase family)
MTNQPLRRFSGRTVLITGAAGAIGQAAAKRFAAEGARVALVDRDAARVAQVADQLIAQGHAALSLGADVADEPAIAAAIAQAEAHFGRIDVVFNNAGIGGYDISVADMPFRRP